MKCGEMREEKMSGGKVGDMRGSDEKGVKGKSGSDRGKTGEVGEVRRNNGRKIS